MGFLAAVESGDTTQKYLNPKNGKPLKVHTGVDGRGMDNPNRLPEWMNLNDPKNRPELDILEVSNFHGTAAPGCFPICDEVTGE